MNAQTDTQVKPLSERAMIVRLVVSKFINSVQGNDLAAKLDAEYNATKATRVTKRLVSEDTCQGFKSARNTLHALWYRYTLPWGDNGQRIMTAEAYMEFAKEYAKAEAQFMQEAEKFIANFDSYKEQAKQWRGDLYREEEYPSAEALRKRFAVKLDISPVPDQGDFRVALSDDERAKIQDKIAAAQTAMVDHAQQELWQTLQGSVNDLIERLSDTDAKNYTKLFNSIKDLVQRLPLLNVKQDPAIQAMGEQLLAKLEQIDLDTVNKTKDKQPDEINEMQKARQAAASDVKGVLDQMSGYL